MRGNYFLKLLFKNEENIDQGKQNESLELDPNPLKSLMNLTD